MGLNVLVPHEPSFLERRFPLHWAILARIEDLTMINRDSLNLAIQALIPGLAKLDAPFVSAQRLWNYMIWNPGRRWGSGLPLSLPDQLRTYSVVTKALPVQLLEDSRVLCMSLTIPSRESCPRIHGARQVLRQEQLSHRLKPPDAIFCFRWSLITCNDHHLRTNQVRHYTLLAKTSD